MTNYGYAKIIGKNKKSIFCIVSILWQRALFHYFTLSNARRFYSSVKGRVLALNGFNNIYLISLNISKVDWRIYWFVMLIERQQLQINKGRTIRYLGGGGAIFLCANFFSSPNCLQEFFFCKIPLHDILFKDDLKNFPGKFVDGEAGEWGGFFDWCKTPF